MSQCFYSHESFNNLIVIDLLIPQHELYPFIEYQISISIELVFVLCESPPLTGISHDKPSFLLTFHFLLLQTAIAIIPLQI